MVSLSEKLKELGQIPTVCMILEPMEWMKRSPNSVFRPKPQ